MRGQIRKRGKSWSVVIYLGRDDHGQRRYKWSTHPTRRDAEAHLAQVLVQTYGGGIAAPSRLKTGDFLEQWLKDDVKKRLEPTTEAIYRNAIERLRPTIGGIPLMRLSAPVIQHALNGMSAKLSPATIHQTYRTLVTALNTAVAWRLLVYNPCQAVKPPVVDERPATVWDEEQARLFFAQARRSSLHYRLYLLIACTGARPGEALALKWPAVNLTLGEITLREKLYRLGKQQIWGATKTHQQDVVPIPPALVEELRRHREEQRRQKALLADDYKDHGLVFCQPNGKPLHERNIYRRDFKRTVKRAGVPQVRLYDLRHCHASHLADAGVPVPVVQRQMRHRSSRTTLKYYVHPLRDARQAVNALADRLLAGQATTENSRE